MAINVNNKLKNQRRNKIVNRSFDDFKNELLIYARTNFPNQINDFSDSSLGGMLVDFASSVGESLSYYLEQQFNELDYESAVQNNSIVNHLRKEGINRNNPTPSLAEVTFFIEVPVDSNNNQSIVPDPALLPIIKKETTLSAESGVNFVLEEDIDFRDNYTQNIGSVDNNGNVASLVLSKKGICMSGEISIENVSFENTTSNNFLSYELNNENVISIINIIDSDLNKYYEVEFLNQDTVYKKVEKSNSEDLLYLDYAAYRYIIEDNFITGRSTVRFGNGSEKSLDDDILINPEDIALPVSGKGYTSDFSLDPNNLLKSNTFGISPKGKNLQIKYKHGGGSDDNVSAGQISIVGEVIAIFPNDITGQNESESEDVINSLSVVNEENAVGGSDSLTLEELQQQIPNLKKMQNRIINYQDLLARIYTMPSNFGRIHKAAVLNNEYSNLSKDLYVICKDSEGFYTNASNALKKNLKTYLNTFRLIGDSYNILDTPIYNIKIDVAIKVLNGFESTNVLNNVAFRLEDIMRFDSLQIGEAINLTDVINVIINTPGVSGIITETKDLIKINSNLDNFYDEDEDEIYTYSSNTISTYDFIENNLLYPGRVGIFELKYSEVDINVRNG